jgi:hypothetical protein
MNITLLNLSDDLKMLSERIGGQPLLRPLLFIGRTGVTIRLGIFSLIYQRDINCCRKSGRD